MPWANLIVAGLVYLGLGWLAGWLLARRHAPMLAPAEQVAAGYLLGCQLGAWLPFLLLWAVRRFGYDRRAWLAQTALTWLVLPICFFFTDAARALNGVFGPSGEHPQTWMAPGLWLALLMVAYPLCVYLPSHLLLRQCFRGKPCVNDHAEARARGIR